jgi:hypothetical protein
MEHGHLKKLVLTENTSACFAKLFQKPMPLLCVACIG